MADVHLQLLHLASNDVLVPEADVEELARCIAAMNDGQAPAHELLTNARFASDAQKHLARWAIEAWWEEPGTAFPEALKRVHRELLRDLRLPPFDR